jgi:hypothetical protein
MDGGNLKKITKKSGFTDKGLDALFNWIDRDFTEYETIAEFHEDYKIEDYPTHAHINDRTILIMVGTKPEEKAFIIKNFPKPDMSKG